MSNVIVMSVFTDPEPSDFGFKYSYTTDSPIPLEKNEFYKIGKAIEIVINNEKSDVEKLVQDIQDSIDIGIVAVEDTDNVMFGTIKKLAEKYLK